MIQINADTILPPDFQAVIEVKDQDGNSHRIYADSIGAVFLKQSLEQNQQLNSIVSDHADLFTQLTPHIERCIIPENPTSAEQTALNGHLHSILEIFATFTGIPLPTEDDTP
jgi:hypothetical protein